MIYILEDDQNICKLLSYALSREGYETRCFSAPELFYPEISLHIPELLLLDIMLPSENGFSVLEKVRSDPRTARLPVIILTAKDSEVDKLRGLDGGADDYVTKPFGVAELIARVRAVLRRSEARERGRIYRIAGLTMDDGKHMVTVNETPVSLSKKEYDLLRILMEGEGRVCSREELLSAVWGDHYGESRTLDVHIRKLRQKLGPFGQMIQTVKGYGYLAAEALNETENL